ncbi:MAG: epoxyqueuosine reductase [Candidatus Azotimanducaceae bacterium]|jgi:epoxyqueuosine reductase
MNRSERTTLIKKEALRLGFTSAGVSRAGFLEEEAPRLEKWLSAGMHGTMSYMENHFDKRLDPTKLVDDAKSVISLLLNYYPETIQNSEAPKISKYAYGNDYHHVIKRKLKSLTQFIHKEIGEVAGRAFVDSAPVLDKAWAKKSGLGWIGKNANLIAKNGGSFFFIAELILDLELEYDSPINDYCGTCTKCIDACPTQAIAAPYQVDGSKCISYFTIELKDAIPNEMKGKFEDWMFGCDICQDVCPWNKFSVPHKEPGFQPNSKVLEMTKEDWLDITEEVFAEVFQKSAVKRAKFSGLKRNIEFISKP